MINLVTPPLQLASDCSQVSCYFNKDLYEEEMVREIGIVLPPKLRHAVQKRKAEFIAGRYCARSALAQLGGSLKEEIGIGANREPLWPQGFVGSITHTHGYACAVVAKCNTIRAVGIDSESWIAPGSMEDDNQQILTASEDYAEYLHLFESPQHYLTLVFSAKESLFKCLFPLVNRFFDFHAALIVPQASGSATNGEFRFELLEDLDAEFCAGYSGNGSYCIGGDFVHTAVVLNRQV